MSKRLARDNLGDCLDQTSGSPVYAGRRVVAYWLLPAISQTSAARSMTNLQFDQARQTNFAAHQR
jgi:hypothetical protein